MSDKLSDAMVRGLKNVMKGHEVHPGTAKALRERGLIFDAERTSQFRDWRLTREGGMALEEHQ